MEFLRQLIGGIREVWQRLSVSARVNLGLAALGAVAIVTLMAYVGARPEYVDLYKGLSTSDFDAVRTYLSGASIPYKSNAAEGRIQVPARYAGRARSALAEQKLPKTHIARPGMELFDQADFTSSQFQQEITRLRATQGELERMINQFSFVNRSWVMISEGKDSLYINRPHPSEAAVLLELAGPVTEKDVRAVLQLVSSAGGYNLTPNHVTITDTDNTILWAPPEDGVTAFASTKFENQRKIEREREQSVRDAFKDIGVRAVVRVTAKINFDETTERVRKAEEGVALSTYEEKTTMTTSEGPPEGAPGAAANIVEEGFTGAGASQTRQESKQTIKNMEPSYSELERKNTGGEPTDWNVAVLVARKIEAAAEGQATGQGQPMDYTQEELESFRDLAAMAVGIEPESVKIHQVSMPDQGMLARAVAAGAPGGGLTAFRDFLTGHGARILQILVILVMLLIARRALLRATLRRGALEEEAEEEARLSPEEMRRRQVASDVERLSREEPEAVASLLRTWMSESKE